MVDKTKFVDQEEKGEGKIFFKINQAALLPRKFLFQKYCVIIARQKVDRNKEIKEKIETKQ